MTKIIETERLLMRAWTRADAARLFEICRQPEVMKHVGDRKPYTQLAQAEQTLAWAEEYQKQNGFCRWSVIEKESAEIIGSCGFIRLAETGEVELGYLFDKCAWGKGYATEAAGACKTYGFSKLGFSELVALTDPDHFASQNVLTKIGFTKRGLEIYDNEENLVYSAKQS